MSIDGVVGVILLEDAEDIASMGPSMSIDGVQREESLGDIQLPERLQWGRR